MSESHPKSSTNAMAFMPPRGNEAARSDVELSLGDIIDFGVAHYRKFILAGLVGGVLGFMGWYFLANFQAELTLLNSNKAESSKAESGLELVSWRTIAQSLPNLADQIVQEGKAPQGADALYRQMSEAAWWQKNAQPTYALSKADMKDLAAVGKELDGAATSILSITMTAAGKSHQSALDNVRLASRFLLSGGAYLQLLNTLNGYESEAVATKAEIERQISATHIELGYLQERAVSLESLLKRFPADQKMASQVVDPKDSGAKYLPISTQIIALNTEIYQKREALQRLGDRLAQMEIIGRFLKRAIPKSQSEFDGLLLVDQLLETEGAIRKSLPPTDLKAMLPLDQLRARLLSIKNRFTKGLEANTAPIAKHKRGMIKATAAGFALAIVLTLVGLLGGVLLTRLRKGQLNLAS